MSDNKMPERIWMQQAEDWFDGTLSFLGFDERDDESTEYIRADVVQAQLDAERKRIVDAIDSIVGMNPSFDVHLSAQAIKAAVWNSDDDPQEILKRELRRMPK